LVKQPDILILDEATSALDAESETLVNQALASLLRDSNTTISIAHRLSTIKRSDIIITLSNDGRVAEVGTFEELSNKPDGAFTKLMEWQMSGGETPREAVHNLGVDARATGPPTEKEEIEHLLHTEDGEEGEPEEEIEGSKVQEVVEEAVKPEKK
jgi:putative ABC transport system ATP-binding protein